MNNDTYITSIVKSTRRVRELYDEAISRAASECGITKPEADVLLFLYNNPTLNTARDIVYYRGFSKAYVSKAVEPLLHRGYLSQVSDAQDRRKQLLSISGGEDMIKKLHRAQEEFMDELTRDIPQSDLDVFQRVSELMNKNAERTAK